jgi:hypothetical protein
VSDQPPETPRGRERFTWLAVTLAVSGLLFFACLVMFLLALLR